MILTLPSKTAQRMANNYGFSISELPIELGKGKTNLIWQEELTNHPTFEWIKNQIKMISYEINFLGAGYCSRFIIPLLGKRYDIICTLIS